jgi:hypothetical protein
MNSGLNLGSTRDGALLTVPIEHFDTHGLLLSPTGRGKTRLLVRTFMELAQSTDACVVALLADPQAFRLIRSNVHELGLGQHLVPIDPRAPELICGINPLQAWTSDLEMQAACSADVFMRALGQAEFQAAPMMSHNMANLMLALLSTGLTMHEAPLFLDVENPRFRRAVIERMPDSAARSEWLVIDRAARHSTPVQLLKTFMELLGSVHRRIGHYTRNSFLRPMLSTRDHAIKWSDHIDRGSLIPIHLSQEGNALTLEHQRLIGAQILASLLRETMSRPESEWQTSTS